jgi:predicted house-cleaning noncanonical NTP pyrophosphatase (MazG superfamily)
MTHKLVRDQIPVIIRANGGHPVIRIASETEYRHLLREKLAEETREVSAADDADMPEELADVLEVVRAIGEDLGLTPDDLERIRAAKAAERGGFTGRVVWYPEIEKQTEAGA